MKRVIFLAFVLFAVNQADAGNSKFGIKGGFHFSTLPSEIPAFADNASLTALKESHMGYHIGLVGSFVFPGFFLQPELLVTSTGRDMLIEPIDPAETAEFFTQNFRHLSMPVMVGLKVGPIKLGAGPVFSLLMNQENDATQISDLSIDLRKITAGYQLSGGLHIGSLLLEVRYESSLTRFGEGVSIGGNTLPFDMRPRQMILSLGLLF